VRKLFSSSSILGWISAGGSDKTRVGRIRYLGGVLGDWILMSTIEQPGDQIILLYYQLLV
jgi:hypothetical protein